MLYLKNLLNKSVVDATSCKELGSLAAVTLDKQSGKCLLVTEIDCIDGEIISVKNDKIEVARAESKTSDTIIKTGLCVYDTTGKSIGTVTDVAFGKKLKFGRLITENGEEYTRSKIYAVKDVVLTRVPAKKRSASAKKETTADTAKKPSSDASQNTNNTVVLNAPYPKKRKYGDFSFLIGKYVDKNIINFYGETMLKAGDRITADKLKQAKRSGKLIELCLHAK
ncbi:MAG: hypothetical protein NC099_01960 [Corallococcus sp.]|nr:hypothetical protein [Bacillota bacterium]MCM1533396.1 hypothetical protein [Corallococcus sp.]